MLGIRLAFSGLLTALLITTFSFSQISLEIKNVDTSAETLDIYMTNQAGCSYCTDSEYVNKTGCEIYGSVGATWEFSTEIDSATCVAWDQNNEEGIHGDYFDGEVKGFQFELFGMTLTGISGGLADEYLDYVSYNAARTKYGGIHNQAYAGRRSPKKFR